MGARLLDLPFIVILMGVGAAAMFLPATHALVVADHRTARAFFYSGLLFLVLFSFIAVATSNRRVRRTGRSHLLALAAAYTVLPLMLAVPFHEAVRNTSFLSSYIEMVSSLTTTGATLYDARAACALGPSLAGAGGVDGRLLRLGRRRRRCSRP
jgi:trk system potassium uptake protein